MSTSSKLGIGLAFFILAFLTGVLFVAHYYSHYTTLPIYPDSMIPYFSAGLLILALWYWAILFTNWWTKGKPGLFTSLGVLVYMLLSTLWLYNGACSVTPCFINDVPDHAALILKSPIKDSGFPLTTDPTDPYRTGLVRVLAKNSSWLAVVDERTGASMEINQDQVVGLAIDGSK